MVFNIAINRGDVYGIVGTNGSGKSTLLKIIAGVLEPIYGTYAINGTIAPLIELGAGFDHELTARENVYLNGALLGCSKKFIDGQFDAIVDFAEVGDFRFQEKCEARISDLVENHGTTLLFVSHDINQLERVCKKAVWIEKGHMRMDGPVDEVCAVYKAM